MPAPWSAPRHASPLICKYLLCLFGCPVFGAQTFTDITPSSWTDPLSRSTVLISARHVWLGVLSPCLFTAPVTSDAFTLFLGFVVCVPCWSARPALAGSSILFPLCLQHWEESPELSRQRGVFSNERTEGAAQSHLLQVETPRASGDAGVSDTEAVGWPLSLAPAPGP